MKYFLFLLLSGILFSANAQKRTYLDKKLTPTSDSVTARYYLVTKPINENQVIRQRFLINGKLLSEEACDPEKGIRNGIWNEWHETTGKRRLEANYKAGKLNGAFRTYFKNGKLRRDDLYKKGKLISGKCFSQTGQDTTYFAFETPPVFPGGNQQFFTYLKTHLKKLSKRDARLVRGFTGRTIVSFVIDTEGKVTDARIVKSAHKQLDKEVLKIVKQMPRWEPGKQDGTNVKVMFTLPIRIN